MIHSFVFSEGKLVAQNLDIDALRVVRKDKGLVTWIDLDCPTEEESRQILESMFGFHPLAIEDCLTKSELPKLEDYEDHLFMVVHAVDLLPQQKFQTVELNLFVGRDFVVTYHLEQIRPLQIMQEKMGKHYFSFVRGADRVAHIVLDGLIDHYKPITDQLSLELEQLEVIILEPEDEASSMQRILEMRKKLSELRRIVSPQREVIYRLTRGENKLIRPHLIPYYRDLLDHLNRVEQTITSYTERLMVDFDVYINRTAHQANEGIKVLTSITALTLPPMVIGSWYGMNFRHMPELDEPHSYWIAMGVMAASIIGMWIWLKRKKWV